jgi:hypothetical protein
MRTRSCQVFPEKTFARAEHSYARSVSRFWTSRSNPVFFVPTACIMRNRVVLSIKSPTQSDASVGRV